MFGPNCGRSTASAAAVVVLHVHQDAVQHASEACLRVRRADEAQRSCGGTREDHEEAKAVGDAHPYPVLGRLEVECRHRLLRDAQPAVSGQHCALY